MNKQIILTGILAILLSGFQCGNGDLTGGAGAEFDATLYYTKTASDALYASKDLVTVVSTTPVVTGTLARTLTALCPTSHPIAVSGGFELDLYGMNLITNSPLFADGTILTKGAGQYGAPIGWKIAVDNTTATGGNASVSVTCTK